MKITSSQIGNFTSTSQLNAYQSAKQIMDEADQIMQEMIRVDDVADIDFSDKGRGNVTLDGHQTQVGDYNYKVRGHGVYDTSSNEPQEMKATIIQRYDPSAHYSLTRKKGLFGLGDEKVVIKKRQYSHRETVTINQRTGTITFNETFGPEGGY